MSKAKKPSAKEKRRQVVEDRRNRRFKAVIGILVLAIAGEALYIYAKSDTFTIRRIEISGNQRTSRVEIVKASGLNLSTNIFDFSAPKTARLIERIPWIKSAECARRWPLTVAIKVKERVPRAALAQSGRFYLLDSETRILQETEAPPPGFAVISDAPAGIGLMPGVKAEIPAVRNAIECIIALDPVVAADIGSISAPTIDGLALKLKSGPVIMYGKTEMAEQKNYAIRVILEEAAKEGKTWQYIDVRVPSNPVAKATA